MYTTLVKSVFYAYFCVIQLTITNERKEKQMAKGNMRRIE